MRPASASLLTSPIVAQAAPPALVISSMTLSTLPRLQGRAYRPHPRHRAPSPASGGGLGWGLNRLCALELGAVHQPAGRRVEGVAAVHRTAIVPPHEVADLPFLGPGEAIL